MDSDPQTTSDPQEQPDQERQNRRQFFNGLGKWSLAIIAAASALREGADDLRDGIAARFGAPATGSDNPLQQIARHGNRPHQNIAPFHVNNHGNSHGNFYT